MEKERSCLYDSLTLYDGDREKASTRIGRYCGHRRPPDALSSGPSLLIVLETDESVNDGGFNITWTSETVKGQTRTWD